jgi:DNA-binding MarR family transcriptional regulator
MVPPIELQFRNALSSASRSFKAAAAVEMRALGVHAGQNFLLDALRDEQTLTTGELARRMHVEVPTATVMTQRMEAARLVTRRPDPDDRRRMRIALTAEGRKAANAVPQLLDAAARQALKGFTQAERKQLVDLLERVASNLGWPAAREPERQGPVR